MTKIATAAAVLLVCALVGKQALAEKSPTDVLEKANKKIEKLVDKDLEKGSEADKRRDKKIKKIVDGFLDFDTLARKSLGKYWKERTDEEKKEFKELFRELVQRNYMKQIHEKADYVVEYDDEEIDGNKATVYTTVRAKSKKGEEAETSLVYRMRKAKQKWLVVDIVTDEVSLVLNYRSQFSKIIKKDGYEVLVQKIRNKIEKDESSGNDDDDDIE